MSHQNDMAFFVFMCYNELHNFVIGGNQIMSKINWKYFSNFFLFAIIFGIAYSIVPYLFYRLCNDIFVAPIIVFLLSLYLLYKIKFKYSFSLCVAFIFAYILSSFYDLLWSESIEWFGKFAFSFFYSIFIAPAGFIISLIIAIVVTVINKKRLKSEKDEI